MPPVAFVTVVIPTYNEAENIGHTARRVVEALSPLGIKYEVLVIDDCSQDGTARVAQEALAGRGRVICREAAERSLSLSVLEGLRQAAGDALVVMDGDGNHPPELLPLLIANLNAGFDLAIASRYVKGGRSEEHLARRLISRFACCLGRAVTGISDNTSGFFAIKRAKLALGELQPIGFKIGLEIFVKSCPQSVAEVPFTFMSRTRGRSKFGARETAQYLLHISRLIAYKARKRICHYCL